MTAKKSTKKATKRVGNRTNHPVKEDSLKRSKKIIISVTKDELDMIKSLAKDDGKTVTSFFVDYALSVQKKRDRKSKKSAQEEEKQLPGQMNLKDLDP